MKLNNRIVGRVLPVYVGLAFGVIAVTPAKADPPILTDEFDAFLVTSETEIGEVVGQIKPVFPNDLPITYSLIKPVPGGDPRNYLKEGQADATDIVGIRPETGEVYLKRSPEQYPVNFYAEVRGTNADGYMEQVLIIIALRDQPTPEKALDMFTKQGETNGIRFVATENIPENKFQHALKIANALLEKDRQQGGKVLEKLHENSPMMTLFDTFDERNTAVGFYMFADQYNSQDLEGEEILPDYVRLGGPPDMRRDASIEEITHLIHGNGIIPAYPEWQERLEASTQKAIGEGRFRPWDGLPADSFSHEYLTLGLEIYYSVHTEHNFLGRIEDEDGNPIQPPFRLSTNNDVSLTRENLKKYDPGLYEAIEFIFPDPATFRQQMGWD